MNKEELIKAISERSGEARARTENIINTALEIITETLADGEAVKLIGFGKFEVQKRAARIGRNPRANIEVHIPETRKPVFKAGKALLDAVGPDSKTGKSDGL